MVLVPFEIWSWINEWVCKDSIANFPYKLRVDATHIKIPNRLISFLPQTQYKFHLYGHVPIPKPLVANFTLELTFEIVY